MSALVPGFLVKCFQEQSALSLLIPTLIDVLFLGHSIQKFWGFFKLLSSFICFLASYNKNFNVEGTSYVFEVTRIEKCTVKF